nr:Os02g0205700 [Ipomoea trifida]
MGRTKGPRVVMLVFRASTAMAIRSLERAPSDLRPPSSTRKSGCCRGRLCECQRCVRINWCFERRRLERSTAVPRAQPELDISIYRSLPNYLARPIIN